MVIYYKSMNLKQKDVIFDSFQLKWRGNKIKGCLQQWNNKMILKLFTMIVRCFNLLPYPYIIPFHSHISTLLLQPSLVQLNIKVTGLETKCYYQKNIHLLHEPTYLKYILIKTGWAKTTTKFSNRESTMYNLLYTIK